MHTNHMLHALSLAKKGAGFTKSNPMVGAVIVKNGRVIGQGYHQEFGGPHAEVNALKACSENPKGATLYVTLEPCCHQGKTPPCTQAIIGAGLGHVVVGALDPNPLVRGKGIQALKQAGIQVTTGVLADQAATLNKAFNHFITHKTPYLVLKTAMSLDGKIATSTGESRWISSPESRSLVHEWRHDLDAVMVGIGTVLADDPSLLVRTKAKASQPLRVVVDSRCRVPLKAQVVQSAFDYPLVVYTTHLSDPDQRQALASKGVRVVVVEAHKGRVDLKAVMDHLASSGVSSVLLEGGGTLNDTALRAGLVHQVRAFIAPIIIGGDQAKTPVEGKGFKSLNQALRLKNLTYASIGPDVLIEGELDHVYRHS